jgi:hypothetical protein
MCQLHAHPGQVRERGLRKDQQVTIITLTKHQRLNFIDRSQGLLLETINFIVFVRWYIANFIPLKQHISYTSYFANVSSQFFVIKNVLKGKQVVFGFHKSHLLFN